MTIYKVTITALSEKSVFHFQSKEQAEELVEIHESFQQSSIKTKIKKIKVYSREEAEEQLKPLRILSPDLKKLLDLLVQPDK